MAIVSSHILDSVTGDHAGGIAVELFRLDPSGARVSVLRSRTDAGGRFAEEVTLDARDAGSQFEMVLHTGEYFSAHAMPGLGERILEEVVVRFRMPDPEAKYHIPLMLAPNSYSVWWSG